MAKLNTKRRNNRKNFSKSWLRRWQTIPHIQADFSDSILPDSCRSGRQKGGGESLCKDKECRNYSERLQSLPVS